MFDVVTLWALVSDYSVWGTDWGETYCLNSKKLQPGNLGWLGEEAAFLSFNNFGQPWTLRGDPWHAPSKHMGGGVPAYPGANEGFHGMIRFIRGWVNCITIPTLKELSERRVTSSKDILDKYNENDKHKDKDHLTVKIGMGQYLQFLRYFQHVGWVGAGWWCQTLYWVAALVAPEMNVKIVDSGPDGGVISHIRKYNLY